VRAKAIAAVLALGALATLALPGGAVATVRHYRQSAQVDAFLSLRGSHGFDFDVLVFSQHSGVLLVSKQLPDAGSETVTYANVGRPRSVGGLKGHEHCVEETSGPRKGPPRR
jgi:hypothetical protein